MSTNTTKLQKRKTTVNVDECMAQKQGAGTTDL